MGRLSDTGIARAVKVMLKGEHDVYSVTNVGVDVQSVIANCYVNSLRNLMSEEEIPFEDEEFMERAVNMCENIWPSQFYIIGAKEGGGEQGIRYKTNKLISLVKECPEGPVLEKVKTDYSYSPNASFKDRPSFNDFMTKTREGGLHVLTVAHGPKYFTRDVLSDISELFLAPILRARDSRF